MIFFLITLAYNDSYMRALKFFIMYRRRMKKNKLWISAWCVAG